MRRLPLLAAVVLLTGCMNRHVNGTTLPAEQTCEKSWVAVLTNGTDRYYDLYVGSRLVGTAEPRGISRITIDPALGQVTPTYRVARTSENVAGPRLGDKALRMSCE